MPGASFVIHPTGFVTRLDDLSSIVLGQSVKALLQINLQERFSSE